MNRERSNEAWCWRENGDNITAIAIWWQMYEESINSSNYSDAIDLLFDISVAWRNEGKTKYNIEYINASISTLKMAEYWAKVSNSKIRNDYDYYLANTLMDAGRYTEAAARYKKVQKAIPDPEQRSEIESKIGYAYAKTGSVQAGIKMMKSEFEFLRSRKDTYHEGISLTAIKLTGAAIRLAEFTENPEEKRRLLEGARGVAEVKGLKSRKMEIEKLLEELT